jgi:tryptophanyl-tRNA synthetase
MESIMDSFEKVKKILKDGNIPSEIVEINADSLSIEDHVAALGISYEQGLSTLIFKDEIGKFHGVLRSDNKKINSSELKKLLKVKKLSIANPDDLKKLGFEPGLVSPFLLLESVNSIVVDNSLANRSNFDIYCGSCSANHAVKIDIRVLIEYMRMGANGDIIEGTFLQENLERDNHKKRILTGDRPTGKMHIGHYLGSLLDRVELQHEYEQFVMIANIQALTDNFEDPGKVKESIGELLCDYKAVGIDFDVSKVIIQSEIPEIHEIFIYLANFASVQQISHNPTIKTELAAKGMEASTPLGFFIYPVHQAADILCVNADLVPVGKDQAPMIEGTRELARKFNKTYNVSVLNEPRAKFGVEKNIPGTDGNSKMGKSLNNAIYLSDDEATLRKKIFSVYTDPNRIRATDPGTVEGNVAFTYHDYFNDDKDEVFDLKQRYESGTVGDVEVKEKLFEAMNKKMAPIREKRKEAEEEKDKLFEKAMENSIETRKISRGIADAMKEAMMISMSK